MTQKDIELLLELQQLDQDYRKINITFQSHEKCKEYSQANAAVTKANEIARNFMQKSIDIKALYESYVSKYNSLLEEYNDTAEFAKKNDSTIELNQHIKGLNIIANELKKIQDALNELVKQSDKLQFDFDSIMEEGKKYSSIKKDLEPVVDKLKKEFAPDVKKITDRQKKIRDSLSNPNILANYEALKSAKKFPILVEYVEKSSACKGCGMNLDITAVNKLKLEHFVECPNCGRLVYDKN